MNPGESPIPFCEHPVAWTDEKVARFWNFLGRHEAVQANYFSKQVGRGIVQFLKRTVPLDGRILDFGCGPGHLAEQFIEAGIACEGLDSSEDSVREVNRRLEGRAGWRGAVVGRGRSVPYDDGAFDLVVCLETIEHILPAHQDAFLAELRRILNPTGGLLFLTTPNAEAMDAATSFCPDCGAIYHRWQHQQAFTPASLARQMESAGYATVRCGVTNFDHFQRALWPGLLDVTPRRLGRIAWSSTASALDALRVPGPWGGYWINQYLGRGQNLFWIGKRKSS